MRMLPSGQEESNLRHLLPGQVLYRFTISRGGGEAGAPPHGEGPLVSFLSPAFVWMERFERPAFRVPKRGALPAELHPVCFACPVVTLVISHPLPALIAAATLVVVHARSAM